jgi:hypothetical protein
VPIDVALASCTVLPEPDADLPPLLSSLRAAGLTVEVLAWDDPAADFASARLTLLRSTWNYSERPAEFLAWIDRVAAQSALWNQRHTVRWNAHKSYLLDLEARGVPVVPTHLVRRGATTTLAEVTRDRGWSDVVVKPAVSGGSRATVRVTAGARDRGEAHLRTLAAREDVLVQPYLASVEGHGERRRLDRWGADPRRTQGATLPRGRRVRVGGRGHRGGRGRPRASRRGGRPGPPALRTGRRGS